MTHARFRDDDLDQAAKYASIAGFPAVQIGNSPGIWSSRWLYA